MLDFCSLHRQSYRERKRDFYASPDYQPTYSIVIAMHRKIKPGTRDPNKRLQALFFIRALTRIKKSPFRRSISQGRKSISQAAYAAMAMAAGPKRAWSRALLLRLRKNRKSLQISRETKTLKNRADQLRRLLPGATNMEFGCLLGETFNYINCLTTQIGIMQKIVDSLGK